MAPGGAVGLGASPCPAGWVGYVDPGGRFSICYPSEFSATASDDAVNLDSPRFPGQQAELLGLAVGWDATPGTAYYPPSAENCPQYLVMGQTASAFLELTLDGRAVPACFNQGRLDGTPAVALGSVQGAIPVAADGSDSDGYIRFAANFTGQVEPIPPLAGAIIATLHVGAN